MFKAFLLAFLLLVVSSQLIAMDSSPIVGGYQPYTDLGSQQFQNVLSFVNAKRPDLKDFKVTAVQRQLVNGLNYKISFGSSDGCSCDLKVYSTFQGDLTITEDNPIICPTVATVTPVLTPTLVSGGYTVQSNPSGDYFQAALRQALNRNSKYLRSDLVMTETQVVAGTNYRFTFRNSDGTLSQIAIFISIAGIIPDDAQNPSDNTTVAAPVLIGGGWRAVTDPNNYADPLKAIYDAYPEVKSYFVSGVESQVVAGRNFRIGLQNNTGGYIRYALFKVFMSLNGDKSVTLLEWINEAGYNVAQIQENYNSSIQLHKELTGATVTRIENIWQKEGLTFTFEREGKKNQVFIYTRNGKTNNLIF